MTAGSVGGRSAGSLAGSIARSGGPSALTPPLIFLGSNLVEIWDSRDATLTDPGGANEGVDTWTGQKLGLVVSAAAANARAALNASDAAFGGAPTVQTVAASSRRLFSAADHGSDILATSTRPYVAAFAAITQQNGRYNVAVDNATGTNPTGFAGVGGKHVFIVNNSVFGTGDPVSDANPHLYEGWAAGSTGNIAVDGAVVNTFGSAPAISAATRRIGIGCTGAGGSVSSCLFALVVICAAVPTPSERAQLLAYCQAEFG